MINFAAIIDKNNPDENMDELAQDVKEFYMLRDYPNKTIWNGGGGRISINRHIINYRDGINTDGTFDAYFWADIRVPCFVLKITKEGVAILQSVERRAGCFIDDHDISKDLVNAAIKLAKNKKASSFQFMDNSFIQCPEKVHLADLSFLTTSKTWYESFLQIVPLDIIEARRLEKYRSIVIKNTWSTVYQKMKTMGEYIELDTEGIDIFAEGSAMIVLDRAKANLDCCRNLIFLVICSGISSLQGLVWTLSGF
jgi:hypothetical protein